MAATIQNAEYYCFKKIGHVPQIEQPKIFAELVLKFIGKY
jgi:pimeloyl-ACP methyl ester carboxylesterase